MWEKGKLSHNFLMGYELVIYVTCLTIDMHYLCVWGQLDFDLVALLILAGFAHVSQESAGW